MCEIFVVSLVSRLQNRCHSEFVEFWFVVRKLFQEGVVKWCMRLKCLGL
jgi:hypothetical protein